MRETETSAPSLESFVEHVRSVLRYDEKTGYLAWITPPRGRSRPGNIAGTKDSSGHVQVRVSGRIHLAHRLIWVLVHGKWPAAYMDHINGNRSDNRLENLREATPLQNSMNKKISKSSTSGRKGVTWSKSSRKWKAVITSRRKAIQLGSFDSLEEASNCYEMAAEQLFGDFRRAP